MKNLFCLIALSLFACTPQTVKVPEVTPIPTVTPTIAKKKFLIAIRDTNYTEPQKKNLAAASKHLEEIFNSEEFQKAVEGRTYTSTTLTGKEVYKKLMEGVESYNKEVNFTMDLKVTMYLKTLTKVVGYTTPGSDTVFTNSKFHSKYSACKIASNLTHEWSHKLGFQHSSASDAKSVPYSLNEIVEKICIN